MLLGFKATRAFSLPAASAAFGFKDPLSKWCSVLAHALGVEAELALHFSFASRAVHGPETTILVPLGDALARFQVRVETLRSLRITLEHLDKAVLDWLNDQSILFVLFRKQDCIFLPVVLEESVFVPN